MLKKPFDRQLVLEKLSKHGIKPVTVYDAPSKISFVSHLEAHQDTHIGLKLWSYIDSLELKLVRV